MAKNIRKLFQELDKKLKEIDEVPSNFNPLTPHLGYLVA